eukprot:6170699-Pleurochrysis_carterae.AAC.1
MNGRGVPSGIHYWCTLEPFARAALSGWRHEARRTAAAASAAARVQAFAGDSLLLQIINYTSYQCSRPKNPALIQSFQTSFRLLCTDAAHNSSMVNTIDSQ